ncbi:MAG: alpha-ketoglutarate-dependent dioxygenase AlkB [Oceanospirillales bacterium LUC14_002_19_P2]|nr:MAG: alpha-ketoglutarate-dependent dioxygenase AlkB [Oceanospirillales bacterium LUC14_002_19_P2]
MLSPDSGSDEMSAEVITLPGGICRYWPTWLTVDEASQLYKELQETVAWQQDEIQMFGRPLPLPRLQVWYGDAGARYRYSGIQLEPLPWLPLLHALKMRVEQATGAKFNSVLVNLYRSGQDSNGWHADDEPELGDDPLVASLSLGATRRFQLRHKTDRSIPVRNLMLEAGSLLFMGAGMQQYWQHQVPKTQKSVSPRINLTFRRVIDLCQ